MDAAEKCEQSYAGIIMPAFDSMHFPQWFFMDTPTPFHVTGSLLKGFFLQCQFYFKSLLEPKPVE